MIGLDLPDGQRPQNRVKLRRQKYFAFSEAQISCMFAASCSFQEGRLRHRHGRWVQDAMDAFVSPGVR
jgi:hypothetical protein